MKKNYILIVLNFLLMSSYCALAQNTVQDSLQKVVMDEVVVTGQYEPQSLKKSIYNVRVITRQDIEQQAAVNLGDVLNQYLNITVTPNSNTGRSSVSMFGLDSQYFKILVDNVPLVNESGFGNNVDLSQINLADVEQIEIIEGSMGVTHGANAVSGILNIITKKSSHYKWETFAFIQEETVGKEYALFNKGRHIQSVKVSHNISGNWFASVGFNRNDFAGYYGDKQGRNYTRNDGRRGLNWLPDNQIVTNALVSYNKNNFRLFYKFDYLNQTIDYYDHAVQNLIIDNSLIYRFANDERFITSRFYHHLNGAGTLKGGLNYNISVSHQKQSREHEELKYFIQTEEEKANKSVTDNSIEVLYSTGTFSNFFKSEFLKFQLGYELTNIDGLALVSGQNQIPMPVSKAIDNYDVFVSGEVNISKSLSIRPGFRYSLQSLFEDQYALSAGIKKSFSKGLELRLTAGQSYRTPTFEELYSRLIFSGHYFIGNTSLAVERSNSLDANIKKTTYYQSGAQMSNNLTVSYLNAKDKIEQALVGFAEGTNTPIYQYINVSNYRMWNMSITNEYSFSSFKFRLGASLIGISQEINNGVIVSDDKFLYSLQINANASYNLEKWKATFAIYYKYNGRQQRFYESFDDNGAVYKLSSVNPYSWLDASAKKSFFGNKLDVMLGAKNILNVVNVQQNQNTAGAAHSGSTDIMLGYGRSYYLKLSYNLNL